MLRLADETLVLAASDLTDHLACPHLSAQRLAVARGERGRPRPVDDPHAELARTRGEAHERAQLERLSEGCGGHVDLSTQHGPRTREELEAGAAATAEAMLKGPPLIYQAQLFDGRWQGRVDFLRRVAEPSALGEHSYEVLDTKLAREVKPFVVHQVSLYSRLVGEIQGLVPAFAGVILGDGTEVTIELGRYAALHRHVAGGLERAVGEPTPATKPEPVAHCGICALAGECRDWFVDHDHLSLVAGARREQRDRLIAMGLSTVRALAETADGVDPGPLGAERFSTLHHQAGLQVESRESGRPRHRHLAPERAAGYALLPPPSLGDVFFDLEGDPYVGDGGIEYLWGWWTAGARYECVWAHDHDEERAAFERFVDRITALRAQHPDLHVYHYAPHERSKLRSLSVAYATRETEVDELLREGVLVDLYAVVRQAMQVGEESYSLKSLERHHGFGRREKRVREGGGSIVAYERWLETGADDLLGAIRAYNEEDCVSTRSLRDWLLDTMAPEAAVEFGIDFAQMREAAEEEAKPPPDWLPEVEALAAELRGELLDDAAEDTAAQAERRLTSHLPLYHYRESKSEWWRFFDLREMSPEELLLARDAVFGLERDESVAPIEVGPRSLGYSFAFPTQDFRLDVGQAHDPICRENHDVVGISDDRIVLKRGRTREPPEPIALVSPGPIDAAVLRTALIELAGSVRDGDDRCGAVRSLLRREPPRLRSGVLDEGLDDLISATLGLDHSVLPVQGPPGTGKTHNGARMIVAALNAGRRVGITAQSHAAIQNMLRAIEAAAVERGVDFAGVYKGEGYVSRHGLVEVVDDNKAVTGDHQLVAGTAWLFSRPEHRERFHLLFIDEAGQFSLADACATGLAAESMVLLGDPQQLPQVTQSEHPDGSGASVLEHLIGEASTIPPGRGVLLTETWRMHPDVCRFVSERSYDGRLRSRDPCSRRGVDAPTGPVTGAGLRVIEVPHEGRSQASREEADAIATACADLLSGGATVTDDEGITEPLTPGDIMVVAPYNLAVRTIAQRVPAGVRVGTVDRFQGQEAPVVFYAMTCSSGEDVPRGIGFLFDKNRLNVAISRAQCLAVLVHCPRLLDSDCPTLEAMELVDGVCRFVEMASREDTSAFGRAPA